MVLRGELTDIANEALITGASPQSGKLVQKMFAKITELIDDSDTLVCVLMDEVESLTAARKASMSGVCTCGV